MKQFVKKEESSERELLSTADARALQALSLSGPGVGSAAQPYPDVPCRYTINNSTDPLSLNWSITRGTTPTSIGSKTVDITWQNVSTGNIYVTGMIGTNLGQVDQRIFINMLDYAAPNFMSAVKQSSAPDVYRHTFSFLYKNTNLKSKWTLPAGCVTTDGKSGTFEINQQVDKNGYLYIDLKNTRLTVNGNITMQAQMPNGLYSQVSTSQYNVTDVSFIDLSAPKFLASTKLSSNPDVFRYTFSDNAGVSQYKWTLPAGCVTTANEAGTFLKAKQVTGGKMYIDLKNSSFEAAGTISVQGLLPQSQYTQTGTASYSNTDTSLMDLSAPKFLGSRKQSSDPDVYMYTFADNKYATQYRWTLPAGCTTTDNESGTFIKTKKLSFGRVCIELKSTTPNVSGDIKVEAILPNSIFTKTTTCKYDNTNPLVIEFLSKPGTIYYEDEEVYTYKVTPISGATYEWIFPEGTVILQGNNTNEIIIKPALIFLGFTVSVIVTHKEKYDIAEVCAYIPESISAQIQGNDSICQTGDIQEYTLPFRPDRLPGNISMVVDWSVSEDFEIIESDNYHMILNTNKVLAGTMTVTAKIGLSINKGTPSYIHTIEKLVYGLPSAPVITSLPSSLGYLFFTNCSVEEKVTYCNWSAENATIINENFFPDNRLVEVTPIDEWTPFKVRLTVNNCCGSTSEEKEIIQ